MVEGLVREVVDASGKVKRVLDGARERERQSE